MLCPGCHHPWDPDEFYVIRDPEAITSLALNEPKELVHVGPISG